MKIPLRKLNYVSFDTFYQIALLITITSPKIKMITTLLVINIVIIL